MNDLFSFRKPVEQYPQGPGFAHDQTSKDAAAFVEPLAPDMEARILEAIWHRPMNCWELEQQLGMSHQTVSARLTKLFNDGKLVKTGERRKAESRSGRVYAVAPAGTAPRQLKVDQIARLTEALEFYRDAWSGRGTYIPGIHPSSELLTDRGDRARLAIESLKQ